ncbi:MAG: hypothetical protein IIV54_00670 [Bacteroidaceae bacterium]|nr:hypothetical protein [Bacteroidaceae bacterium]
MNKEICIKKIRNSTNVSETNAPNSHPPNTRRKGDGSERKKGYGLEKKGDGSSKKGYYFFKKHPTLYLVNL